MNSNSEKKIIPNTIYYELKSIVYFLLVLKKRNYCIGPQIQFVIIIGAYREIVLTYCVYPKLKYKLLLNLELSYTNVENLCDRIVETGEYRYIPTLIQNHIERYKNLNNVFGNRNLSEFIKNCNKPKMLLLCLRENLIYQSKYTFHCYAALAPYLMEHPDLNDIAFCLERQIFDCHFMIRLAIHYPLMDIKLRVDSGFSYIVLESVQAICNSISEIDESLFSTVERLIMEWMIEGGTGISLKIRQRYLVMKNLHEIYLVLKEKYNEKYNRNYKKNTKKKHKKKHKK